MTISKYTTNSMAHNMLETFLLQYSKHALKYILCIFSIMKFIKLLAFFPNTDLLNEGRNNSAEKNINF